MIILKSSVQLKQMEKSGAIVRDTLLLLQDSIKSGMTTQQLNNIANEYINKCKAKPSFYKYNNYPKSICVSVNDEVVHGIAGNRIIKDGDIVSVDVGAYIDGYHADAARTFIVGNVEEEIKQLVKATEESFFMGVKAFKVGNHISDIAKAIESVAIANSLGVVKELCGHGIGNALHEDPEVPNYWGVVGRGVPLKVGMALAIEPMFNLGTEEVIFSVDGWTVRTADGKYSSHYENTVVLTDNGAKILTL